MSQREHAEDTVWWSIKSATEFAAHRRTVVLIRANMTALTNRPNPMKWIDNTGEVWPELRAMLEELNPKRIAVNVDPNIAFAGGMHVGELETLKENLDNRWSDRFVNVPMLAAEYVSARVPEQLEYYQLLEETAWAMIDEAFSERVITPGVTTTEVSIVYTMTNTMSITSAWD